MQFVSGSSGRWRNEAMAAWAQGNPIATKCPTPGMLAILELGSVGDQGATQVVTIRPGDEYSAAKR
jgi:hypothetical protein